MSAKTTLCVAFSFEDNLRAFERDIVLPDPPFIGMNLWFGPSEDAGLVFTVEHVAWIVPEKRYYLTSPLEYLESEDTVQFVEQRLAKAKFHESVGDAK